jgi:hypothetical protein
MGTGECMRLGAEQLEKNWDELQGLITNTFEGDRLIKIKELHTHFEDRMCLAPASGTGWFHNAFPGGYVAHVLNVVDWALKYHKLFEEGGMYLDDIDTESVVFAALFHDLGKIGNIDKDYYVSNTDEWRATKLQQYYLHNPEIHYMSVTDRSIWILNQFEIKISESEYVGLRLADGLYSEQNKSYFMEGAEWKAMKTNLPFIIHYADCTAARLEKETYMLSGDSRIDFPYIMKGDSKPEKEASIAKDPDINTQKLKDLFK